MKDCEARFYTGGKPGSSEAQLTKVRGEPCEARGFREVQGVGLCWVHWRVYDSGKADLAELLEGSRSARSA